VYAETLADNYYEFMDWVEKRQDLFVAQKEIGEPITRDERCPLLALKTQLAERELSQERAYTPCHRCIYS
jgi:hypothetical protein